MTKTATLYYDGSCGMCRREIEHLRHRLERGAELVDISTPDFSPPSGHSLDQMMERIHYFDGQQMLIGLPASLAYWRLAGGGFRMLAALLGLPGLFQIADWGYNRWAAWRIKRIRCSVD